MKKRIISIVLIFFAIGFVATAQPPKPPTGNNIDTRNASKGILGGKTGTVSVREKAVKTTPTTQQNQGHVGTATALLLTLGAGAVGYKIRKNKKTRQEEN